MIYSLYHAFLGSPVHELFCGERPSLIEGRFTEMKK
jgi:hypothetical protein